MSIEHFICCTDGNRGVVSYWFFFVEIEFQYFHLIKNKLVLGVSS